jgi:GxxExxY protein
MAHRVHRELRENKKDMQLNEITGIIIEEAIEVHKELGPGLLESVYEEALYFCLKERGLKVERQKAIPVLFKGIKLEQGFRADLIVEDIVIVELKSQETIPPVHYKKLLTYLRLSSSKVGLLINFYEELLKNGIKRIIN